MSSAHSARCRGRGVAPDSRVFVTPMEGTQPTTVPATMPAPVIKAIIDKKTSVYMVDLGYVEPDSIHSFAIELPNPTAQARSIKQAQSSCKCVHIQSVPAAWPAGGTASLFIDFHAPNQVTTYTTPVQIQIDQDAVVNVRLTARVGLPLWTQIITTMQEQERSYKLRIHNDGQESVRLLYALSSNPAWSITIPADTVVNPGVLDLPLTASPNVTATASSPLNIQIHTSSSVQPSLMAGLVHRTQE